MPVRCMKQGDKHRIVEAATGSIAMKGGKPVDGGGYANKMDAVAQRDAINIAGYGRKTLPQGNKPAAPKDY